MRESGSRRNYSLRALLLGVTVVCFLLGLFAFARTPRSIHRRLEALGGDVETAGLPESADALRWCDGLFGPLKRFHDIAIVEIQSDEFTDEDLARVCELRTVEFLLVSSSKISDAGLRSLSRCNRLDDFLLIAPVTDQGLQVVGELKSLSGIDIVSDEMDGTFLEAVNANAPVESIALRGKQLDDRIAGQLLRLRRVRRVILSGTAVSDAGLLELAHHPNLRFIDVSDTQVTREGLSEFQKLAPAVSVKSD